MLKERLLKLFMPAIFIASWSIPLNASLLQTQPLISQYHHLTDTANPLGQRKAYAYDKMSRVTEVKDPAGNVTVYTYAAPARLTKRDIKTPSGVHAATTYTPTCWSRTGPAASPSGSSAATWPRTRWSRSRAA